MVWYEIIISAEGGDPLVFDGEVDPIVGFSAATLFHRAAMAQRLPGVHAVRLNHEFRAPGSVVRDVLSAIDHDPERVEESASYRVLLSEIDDARLLSRFLPPRS